MKTKIKSLITSVMLSGASVTLLFASPNTQANQNAQTAPPVTVPSTVSNSGGKGGMHTRADTLLPSARYGSHIDLNQTSLILERLDIRSFTLKPNQIGVNRSVSVSPNTRAQKLVNPDGSQIIVLIIKSSGASGIGVHFRNFVLADGEEVYVYGPSADSVVFGPFTKKGPWGSGQFWSGTLVGDTAVIEFNRRRPDEKGNGFEIFEVSHIFPELDFQLQSGEPEVEDCEVDASCNPIAKNNAVARIVYNDNGPKVCTGTLLSDLAQDEIPYFLTANHCVDSQAVALTVEVYWFYQTTSCNSGVLRTSVHSPPGANLLATQNSNDFSLLRLLSIPAGAVFSGWTSEPQSIGTPVFALHHPGREVPQPNVFTYSYLRRSDGNIIETNANCSATGLINGYETHWTSGATEPGSSGSGVFTSNGGYLVGVLSCTTFQPCAIPDSWYSKFANFYPQIRPYIGPGPGPASILGNISTRSFVQTGDNVMIGGFIVQGTQPKRVIIRAIGPTLSQYGVPNVLADPTLELHDGTRALIGSNDDWQNTVINGIITHDQVQEIMNSGHAPGNGFESAIIATLAPGGYTAIVRGYQSGTGVALVEVYDLH